MTFIPWLDFKARIRSHSLAIARKLAIELPARLNTLRVAM